MAVLAACSVRHRVVVFALDGLLPFELGIPQRIFGKPRRHREGDRCTRSSPVGCGRAPSRPTPTSPSSSRNGPEALATADTVVVPASHELGPVHTKAC